MPLAKTIISTCMNCCDGPPAANVDGNVELSIGSAMPVFPGKKQRGSVGENTDPSLSSGQTVFVSG